MNKTENAFDPKTLRQEIIFAAIGCIISLSIYVFVEWLDLGTVSIVIQSFALMALIYTVSQVYWNGATFLSVAFQGERRLQFQIVVSIVTPLLLLMILFIDVKQLDLQAFISDLDWYVLFPIGFTSYVSWFLAADIHEEHPFRRFVLSSAAIFVLIYMSSKNISLGTDEEMDVEPISKAELKIIVEYGGYAIKYFLYVLTSYVVMQVRIIKDKRH